jgi:hypothetical protein
VDSSRKRIAGSVAASLPGETLVGSLSERNLLNSDAALDIARNALKEVGARGFEISVVIPDDSSRIAFLGGQSCRTKQDQKLCAVETKKSVPFDVDSSNRISVGTASLMPRVRDRHCSAVATVGVQNEGCRWLGLHAGYVIPRRCDNESLSVWRRLLPRRTFSRQDQDGLDYDDRLSEGPSAVLSARRQNSGLRGLPDDDVQRTNSAAAPAVRWSADDKDLMLGAELQDKLGVPVKRLEPKTIDDIYKPALGAVV